MKEKIDFGQAIKSMKGVPLRIGATLHTQTLSSVLGIISNAGAEPAQLQKILDKLDKDIGAPLTLCECAVSALGQHYPDEQNLDAGERMKRFRLALRLKPSMVKITAEERDLMKKLIGKFYLDHVIAPQCWLMLEGGIVDAEREPALAAVS